MIRVISVTHHDLAAVRLQKMFWSIGMQCHLANLQTLPKMLCCHRYRSFPSSSRDEDDKESRCNKSAQDIVDGNDEAKNTKNASTLFLIVYDWADPVLGVGRAQHITRTKEMSLPALDEKWN